MGAVNPIAAPMDPELPDLDLDLEARPRRAHGSRLILVVLAVSLLVLGVGGRALYLESTTAGPQAPAPHRWPVESVIQPEAGKSTLVMFVHPKCPCSRASLTELDAIMEHRANSATAWVVFLKVPGSRHEWETTEVWASAGRIPGAKRMVDDGSEAARFGALTSGHTVVYDATGALRFAGGITAARGHAGRNVGRDTVASIIDRDGTEHGDHPVYGCLLAEGPPDAP